MMDTNVPTYLAKTNISPILISVMKQTLSEVNFRALPVFAVFCSLFSVNNRPTPRHKNHIRHLIRSPSIIHTTLKEHYFAPF